MYYIRVVLLIPLNPPTYSHPGKVPCKRQLRLTVLRLNALADGGDASEEGPTGSAIPRSKGRRQEEPGQGQTDGEGHGAVSSGRRPHRGRHRAPCDRVAGIVRGGAKWQAVVNLKLFEVQAHVEIQGTPQPETPNPELSWH